ncbi:efflux RND transporter permease subunit [Novosphingobium sp.]|uniref:efflux RND transporter permease subunit n=1 Tax=Novosphingobium sp. TaxID=1874826 RepID=UPI0031D9A428
MKLAHFFIDHPRFAAVLSIFITIAGLVTMLVLPIAQYPSIVPPTIDITTSFPGANADTIARTVATPLEQAVNGVENMDYITSQSTSDGQLTTTVYFKIGSDPNIDLILTRNRVLDAVSRLPPEVQAQGVKVNKTIKALVLGVHVYSPDGSRSPEYLYNYMLKIRDQISRLPGVSQFQLFGSREYAMRVWVDPDKAAAYNISANEILAALRAQNAQVSTGRLNAPLDGAKSHGAYEVNVETLGRLTTPEEFNNVIVKADAQGHITRIRDIGHAELGASDYGTKAYANKFVSTPWFVVATPDANVVGLEHAIWDKMAQLRKSFPSGVDYLDIYDPTTFVSQSIDEVVTTIGIAILLVVGVVYLFLQSWRATIIPVVAIPISLLGTFTVLGLTGGSINNLSLFGVVLAVGIVVDDAIVVVENVERNMALGMSAREATRRTMNEVSTALIAIALTLCAVFVPTSFIPGISGLFFKQFAITISASTIISAFVSLTLSPALCAVLLKPHTASHAEPHGVRKHLNRFFGRFNHGFTALSERYARLTGTAVRKTGVMMVAYVILIGATAFQMSRMPSGFIPESDIGYLATVIQLPPGSSLERTDKVVREVNEIALGLKTAKGENLIGGTSPVTGLDVVTNTSAPNVGTVFTGLPSLYGKHISGTDAHTVVAAMNKATASIKDARVITLMPPAVQGLGAPGGFTLELEDRGGLGPEALAKATNELVAAANKNKAFAGAFTLFNAGAPSMKADIDREKAEKLGLTPTDIFSTIGLYLGSQYVNDFNFYGRTYPVYVQADHQFRSTTANIGALKVRNAAGIMVPLSAVTTFKSETKPYRVPRYNLYPSSEIIGTAAPGVASGTAIREMEKLADQTLPAGIGYEWTDLAHQQQAQTISPMLIFAASALFVFLVLAAQYESWKIPLAILMIIPMCLLASSTGLHLRTMPIDILAQIGFVVLLGLAAKNAILIVEFARHHQDHEGATPEQASVLAAKERLRPILMTSLAFIAGVFPLAIASGAGSEMRQAMGTAVFSGMIGVTVFGLLFTPAFYTIMRKLNVKLPNLSNPFHASDRRSA